VTLLLDTHTMVWFWLDDPQLSARAKEAISDPDNGILVSPASYWELAIKISLGKFHLGVPYEEFFQEQITKNDFGILPIEVRHAAAVIPMPFHHRDPFDRLIIAQAKVEDIPLVSADPMLDAYRIQRIW
jgi:PIN domain nuclease of toxin-antitoxin system